jgi:hypothetical protein
VGLSPHSPLESGRCPVLISTRGCIDFRITVQLEGFDQLKNPMISSRRKLTTFRLVAKRLNKLCYRVHYNKIYILYLIISQKKLNEITYSSIRKLCHNDHRCRFSNNSFVINVEFFTCFSTY